MVLRWGIVTVGKISMDFTAALSTLPKEDHQVVAVAARCADRAASFAKQFTIPKAYQGYEALAKDPNVDIVYIGALNRQHYEIAVLMLENEKHVLCEKPLCMNAQQVLKLVELAKSKSKFLMEAIWSRFFPAYQYLRKQIEANALGDILEVDVAMGFEIANVARLNKKELGGGTVLDLGVYTIQISQWAFCELPTSITATGTLNAEGVDLSMEAELKYPKGGVARMRTNAMSELHNTATIRGTKGTITLNNFWCPTSLVDVDGSTKEWPLPTTDYEFIYKNSCGLRYEAEEAGKCISNGEIQSAGVSHSDSLTIARIEDEIRRQIGVQFAEDLE